jgi:CubicO group peptidase (beta-lactamase class C family)
VAFLSPSCPLQRALAEARLPLSAWMFAGTTPEQKAASPFFESFWDSRGWGLGLSVVTRRAEVAGPGRLGWDGAFGVSWYVDPREAMVVLWRIGMFSWLALAGTLMFFDPDWPRGRSGAASTASRSARRWPTVSSARPFPRSA